MFKTFRTASQVCRKPTFFFFFFLSGYNLLKFRLSLHNSWQRSGYILTTCKTCTYISSSSVLHVLHACMWQVAFLMCWFPQVTGNSACHLLRGRLCNKKSVRNPAGEYTLMFSFQTTFFQKWSHIEQGMLSQLHQQKDTCDATLRTAVCILAANNILKCDR